MHSADPIEDPSIHAGLARRASAPLPLRALWALWNTLQLLFTLAWTAGLICVALLIHLVTGSAERVLRMASTLWSPGLLGGAGVRFVVEGAERVDWSKAYMIVANHQSMIDICALFRAVPVPMRFLLKREMTRVPFVGRYAQVTGMLFIDRDNARAGIKMMRDATALLRVGATLCIFPEGTRSRDGRVAPFKGGAFQSAIDAGVEVLPVAISGAGAVLPPSGFFRVRPGPIVVRFGAPLPSVGSDRQTLARDAQNAVVAMLAKGTGEDRD